MEVSVEQVAVVVASVVVAGVLGAVVEAVAATADRTVNFLLHSSV